MAAADVAQVTTSIGMQSGDTVYYDIKAVAKDGRKLTLGSGIPDKGEAEWLAEKIRGAMKD
jgi:hypothetical protein